MVLKKRIKWESVESKGVNWDVDIICFRTRFSGKHVNKRNRLRIITYGAVTKSTPKQMTIIRTRVALPSLLRLYFNKLIKISAQLSSQRCTRVSESHQFVAERTHNIYRLQSNSVGEMLSSAALALRHTANFERERKSARLWLSTSRCGLGNDTSYVGYVSRPCVTWLFAARCPSTEKRKKRAGPLQDMTLSVCVCVRDFLQDPLFRTFALYLRTIPLPPSPLSTSPWRRVFRALPPTSYVILFLFFSSR